MLPGLSASASVGELFPPGVVAAEGLVAFPVAQHSLSSETFRLVFGWAEVPGFADWASEPSLEGFPARGASP